MRCIYISSVWLEVERGHKVKLGVLTTLNFLTTPSFSMTTPSFSMTTPSCDPAFIPYGFNPPQLQSLIAVIPYGFNPLRLQSPIASIPYGLILYGFNPL